MGSALQAEVAGAPEAKGTRAAFQAIMAQKKSDLRALGLTVQ